MLPQQADRRREVLEAGRADIRAETAIVGDPLPQEARSPPAAEDVEHLLAILAGTHDVVLDGLGEHEPAADQRGHGTELPLLRHLVGLEGVPMRRADEGRHVRVGDPAFHVVSRRPLLTCVQDQRALLEAEAPKLEHRGRRNHRAPVAGDRVVTTAPEDPEQRGRPRSVRSEEHDAGRSHGELLPRFVRGDAEVVCKQRGLGVRRRGELREGDDFHGRQWVRPLSYPTVS